MTAATCSARVFAADGMRQCARRPTVGRYCGAHAKNPLTVPYTPWSIEAVVASPDGQKERDDILARFTVQVSTIIADGLIRSYWSDIVARKNGRAPRQDASDRIAAEIMDLIEKFSVETAVELCDMGYEDEDIIAGVTGATMRAARLVPMSWGEMAQA